MTLCTKGTLVGFPFSFFFGLADSSISLLDCTTWAIEH